ncbi:hypothetical protein V1519DRAFT_218577 [Lipomyces tetrasporus]
MNASQYHVPTSVKLTTTLSTDSYKAVFSMTDGVLAMSTSKPTFNPLPLLAWSEPLCIAPESRVRYLRTLLSDKSQEYQHKNILFLIHLYETGQLKELRPGKVTWIFDGKIVDGMPKEILKGSAAWADVCRISV